MKRPIRWISLLLMLVMCLGLCAASASADTMTTEEKAAELTRLGLFRGKADAQGNVDPALGDTATRAEAATMLIRLMGREGKALAQYNAGALHTVFADVPAWALPNVTWLYEAGYINGMGGDQYGSSKTVTAQQYAAMVLRALGYNEADGDFAYANALPFAVSLGLLTEAQAAAYSADFRRAGMVEMSYNALGLTMRFSEETLRQKLTRDGVFRGTDTTVSAAAPMRLSLKYSAGGKTNPTYFEEKGYGNAACGDVDGDGRLELVYGIRSIFCVDAATGSLKWRIPTGHDVSERLDPVENAMGEAFSYLPFRILDYDGDGQDDIFTITNVAGTTVCNIAVYNGKGAYKAHWSTQMRVWAAHVEDLDGDGRCEVILGYGSGGENAAAFALYNNDGTVRWSRPCGYGTYCDAITATDLDGDGKKELVMLYDERSIAAFRLDSTEVTTPAFGNRTWRDVPFYEGYDEKLPYTSRERLYGLMGTYGGILASDLDGDGREELLCTGMFVDMATVEWNMAHGVGFSFLDSIKYYSLFLLNNDRTRYTNAAKGYDWSRFPTDLGTVFALENPVIESPSLRPVAADLDGDGEKELLFSSFEGKVHCFDLDGTEHGAWPFSLVGRSSPVLSCASQPVTADVNGDGKLEVIFATYTEMDQTAQRGKLYVLDCTGRVLAETTLPVMFAQSQDIHYPNGSTTAPCVADFDGDGKAEIAVATFSCGVCVYDLD